MMKASGGFGTRWVTDLIITTLSKRAVSQMFGQKSILVPVYKGKGNPPVCGSYRAIKLLEQPMKIHETVLQKKTIRCQLITYSLTSWLARKPRMPFASCDKYKRNTKQRRRSCTRLLWICKRHFIKSQGNW